jgi:hypothetical protein
VSDLTFKTPVTPSRRRIVCQSAGDHARIELSLDAFGADAGVSPMVALSAAARGPVFEAVARDAATRLQESEEVRRYQRLRDEVAAHRRKQRALEGKAEEAAGRLKAAESGDERNMASQVRKAGAEVAAANKKLEDARADVASLEPILRQRQQAAEAEVKRAVESALLDARARLKAEQDEAMEAFAAHVAEPLTRVLTLDQAHRATLAPSAAEAIARGLLDNLPLGEGDTVDAEAVGATA